MKRDDVYQNALAYFKGDELAADVWTNKYALRNGEEFKESTPDDMHRRLASEFARIEKDKFEVPLEEEEIYQLFKNFKYIVPQGSPMYGIGNNYTYQSLGNCFTLGEHPYDSYGGILYADQMLVQLCKRRCGVGLCLDKIRPKGMPTKNAAITTDGIGVFMERFSNSTREVAQHGRRGALMEALTVEHPEIETFINIKRDRTKVTGANISVMLSDQFMEAVKNNVSYRQQWPIDSESPEVRLEVNAKKIWDQIIDAAWESAEPGILFRDNARKWGLSHQYGIIDERFKDIVTNPCGEIWIGFDSCRLMVINIYSYVRHPFTQNAYFDYELFAKHCKLGQRLMDDMVDLEIEKMRKIIEKIKADPEPDYVKAVELDMWSNYLEVAELGRRTGLGITGLGDALAAINVRYGSKESVEVTEEVYKVLAINSMLSSCEMAKELGPFPLYDKEIEKNHPFLERLFEASPELKKLHSKYGRRNISLTTTAPAGSLSILTQTTSGIEPAYLLEYSRRRKIMEGENVKATFVDEMGDKWEEYIVRHHHYQTWLELSGKTNIEESPYFGATSNDVDWRVSVDLQAAAQRWITHSISKTCNVPADTPKELIAEIYMDAYEKGCKGFTVYRDGCRAGVLNKKEDKAFEVEQAENRPKSLDCDVYHYTVKGSPYFVLVGKLDDKPYEVFAGKNGFMSKKIKTGQIERLGKPKCYRAVLDDGTIIQPITMSCTEDEEALTRLISVGLRHGTPLNHMVDQIEKVKGDMNTYARVIARTLKNYIPDGTVVDNVCPECSERSLVRQEGCTVCKNCGYSGCS